MSGARDRETDGRRLIPRTTDPTDCKAPTLRTGPPLAYMDASQVNHFAERTGLARKGARLTPTRIPPLERSTRQV
jgi:hypothetical protein